MNIEINQLNEWKMNWLNELVSRGINKWMKISRNDLMNDNEWLNRFSKYRNNWENTDMDEYWIDEVMNLSTNSNQSVH